MSDDLTSLESHFQFGKNWQSYLETVTEARIAAAVEGLERLFPEGGLQGKTFLDIGCGSGMSMLAALRLGAARVQGIDIDPQSVAAATALLTANAPDGKWSVCVRSVFDAAPDELGQYEIVHSWGVLHHTGAMWRAIDRAGALVAPGGLLALALYRKTPFCGAWTAEKRLYRASPAVVQKIIRAIYKAAYLGRIVLRGESPARFLRSYKGRRGMSWHHDVHDWLGGYPYESVTPDEVVTHLDKMGYAMERVLENCKGTVGLLGTGCDEFVARRRPGSP